MSKRQSISLNCETCNKAFLVPPSRTGKRYCGKACVPAVPDLTCSECGRRFPGVRFSRLSQETNFCTRACGVAFAGKSWERLFASIDKSSPVACWEWPKIDTGDGYGRIRRDGRSQLVHRISYEVNVGPVPDGLFVLHTCDNRGCVNPSHLFLGTQLDNMRDASNKGRLWQQQPSNRAKLEAAWAKRSYRRRNHPTG